MTVELFEVGGCVRDEILGVPTKDIDFTVVTGSFSEMQGWIEAKGFRIWEIRPEHLTIRAKFPDGFRFAGRNCDSLTADFVLSRKDGNYLDGRRPEFVTVGSLEDDIMRRDFTVNALAKDSSGQIIDIVGGLDDLGAGILRVVGDVETKMREDGIRALRALRFSVTKDFRLSDELHDMFDNAEWLPELIASQVIDRRRDELNKMFAHDTFLTINLIASLPYAVQAAMFTGGIWAKPTTEKRKENGCTRNYKR